MTQSERQFRRKMLFSVFGLRHNRCLAPSGSCERLAIRAHSVQNAAVMNLLQRNGHVKAPTYQIESDDSLSLFWRDIGRNIATTFEGFCSTHDTSLFLPIDTKSLDTTDSQQLFLYAYRAVSHELHSATEGAMKLQLAYQKRIEAGIDKGNEPEEAGMRAIARMMIAYSTYLYKEALDVALMNEDYGVLSHQIYRLTKQPPQSPQVFYVIWTLGRAKKNPQE